MPERDDYSGEFDPGFRLEDLSKAALVRLCREYQLVTHILDRAVMPAIGQRFGPKAMEEIAIEEWRGASPVYTERIRKAIWVLGIGHPASSTAERLTASTGVASAAPHRSRLHL